MPTTRRLRARKLTPLQIVPASNPSFVALDPTQTHLYSVNEDTAGRVSAYAVNPANGNLTFTNSASANGQFTTHISVHPSGQYVYAANYGTGNFPVYRILAKGSIGPMTDEFQSVGNGTGPSPARQEGPHAHQIRTDRERSAQRSTHLRHESGVKATNEVATIRALAHDPSSSSQT